MVLPMRYLQYLFWTFLMYLGLVYELLLTLDLLHRRCNRVPGIQYSIHAWAGGQHDAVLKILVRHEALAGCTRKLNRMFTTQALIMIADNRLQQV
ncbi:hypothetical protein PAXRUDRAFT_725301 [Paxillus rubicundulus Ve08.2h10]|uniref:Uncharacterized protein n=1 Tax=Paxillus rubicundulus Ve08.2h10 TaxID=930991 RepID=A0A0D0DUN2_9AGAM|nr:hypothetical protein PAXRUDRAFT_725301 [Paxillus rubicundulus Ve08.2h10]